MPRDELLVTVWPGTTVSHAAVSSVIRDLRRSLEDAATEPRYIATFRGRGLRFVHPVRELPDLDDTQTGTWAAAAIHFERALQLLELVDTSRGKAPVSAGACAPRERGELLVALARVRWSAGAAEPSRSAFLEAAEVARRSGDAEVLAQAALGFAGRTDVTPGVNREAVALLEEALHSLLKQDSALRAELLARMGTELYYDDDAARSEELTREALAMAERVGDRAVTAYALTACHFASQRPDTPPQRRLALADRAISLTHAAPASDVLAFALQERMVDLLELGQGAAFEAAFAQFEAAVRSLRQPFFLWLLSLFRGTRALLAGDVEEAERLANTTLETGMGLGTPNAAGAFAGQLFSVRREQGRLDELAPMLEAAAERNRALPIFRAARAAIAAAAGSSRGTNRILEGVMSNDLGDFPRDQNWIATLGTLAPAAIVARNERRVRQLLGFLRPFADRMIVVGQGATTHGAVSHHLGLLHAALGEVELARAHLDAAESIHARANAPLWLGHTRRARAAL